MSNRKSNESGTPREGEAGSAALQQKKARAKGLWIALGSAALVLLAAGVLLAVKVIIPNSRYSAAVKMYESGNYEEALEAFEALDG